MSSTHPTDGGATDAGIDPAATAATLQEAGFVRLSALATGDALAATGLLAAALRECEVPFQTRVRTAVQSDARPDVRPDGTDDGAVVCVGGRPDDRVDVDLSGEVTPASADAHAVARELGGEPSPTLALAGAVAAGVTPGTDGTAQLLEAAAERGAVERRPGVALPVADPVDGLAHSTLLRAPFSGDPDRARELLGRDEGDEAPTDDARRRIASLVAVAAAAPDGPSPPQRVADAVERALRPYATPDGPFASVGGWGDVLRAVAREEPGTGVALALGGRGDYDPRPAALSAWRTHGRAVHGLLDDATTARYDGLFVVRTGDAPVGRLWTAAPLVRDFRSPEPTVLVVGDGAAAAAASSAPTDAMAAAVAGTGGDVVGDGGATVGRFDGDAGAFCSAFREAL